MKKQFEPVQDVMKQNIEVVKQNMAKGAVKGKESG